MDVGVIGINHKSAELALLEDFSKVCQRHFGQKGAHNFPFILLSTCNRCEIYFSSEELCETHSYLLNVLREDISYPFEHNLYSYFGKDCFFHLACVTSGMDSAIIGESEIQGQVKRAYEMASLAKFNTLSYELHFLFQKSLKIGKEVRTRLSLTPALTTIEEAVLGASTHLLDNHTHLKILLVGLSEINQKVLKKFKKKGFNDITICNRTLEKAISMGLPFLHWEDLFHKWYDFDLVIFGTKSPEYLLTLESLPTKATRNVIIDLSMPRNVDPKLSKQSGITLLNLENLAKSINRKRKIQREMMARAEKKFIAHEIEKQMFLFEGKENRVFLRVC